MRKNRTVVVGTNAYHYLMAYWLHLFEKNWQDEVDHVYFAVSTPIHASVWEKTKEMLESNSKITVFNTGLGWPESVEHIIRATNTESLGIFHDDLFVFKKGIIDKFFSIVENEGKVVVPIHDNFSKPELVKELMQKKYGSQLPLVEEGTDRTGYSFYNNFFFAPMELVKKTSINLKAYNIPLGSENRYLDWTFLTTDVTADTDFLFCLELLEAGAKFYSPIEQDMKKYINIENNPLVTLSEMRRKKEGLYDDIDYLHFQTFAYHVGGLMFDLGERESLSKTSGVDVKRLIHNIPKNKATTDDIMTKISTIYALMKLDNFGNIKRYHKHVKKELKYVQKYFNISDYRLEKMTKYLSEILFR